MPDLVAGRASAMGSAIAALVERVGAPVVLAGHSYGGNIALQAALQARPPSIQRLVLFEPVFFHALTLVGDEAARAPVVGYFEDYARRALAGEPEVVRLMVDYWFGEGAWARMPDKVRAVLGAAAVPNAFDICSTFADAITVGQLGAIDRPVRIAYGERSPTVVRSIASALTNLLPRAALQAIAGANHGMLDTHPEEVAQLISAG